LSLSRSLILLLNARLREACLPQSHGLTSVRWGNVLAADNRRPADLEVKVGRGTFSLMLEVTENADESAVYTGRYPTRLIFRRARPVTGLFEATFTFQQVLSRISELRDVYERSFGDGASNYRAFVFTISPTTLSDVDLFNGRHGLPLEQQLRTELAIPEGVL